MPATDNYNDYSVPMPSPTTCWAPRRTHGKVNYQLSDRVNNLNWYHDSMITEPWQYQVDGLIQVTKVTLSGDSARRIAFFTYLCCRSQARPSDQSSQLTTTLWGRKALRSVSLRLAALPGSTCINPQALICTVSWNQLKPCQTVTMTARSKLRDRKKEAASSESFCAAPIEPES